ncbi:MAG: DUF4127 family protein [Candidatus Baltobacteraceae bacterium]|jgi:hypothetical protein
MLLALSIVFVPLDDRPATAQFPQLLSAIAGVHLVEPPAAALGNYLDPGAPAAILRWLDVPPPDATEFVVSNDMIDYGGLVASRIPAVDFATARARLAALAAVRARHSLAAFTVFGSVMRLAPTGVPAIGAAAGFPFAGDVWPLIQQYAGLPDPPETSEQEAQAALLRSQLGSDLDAYLAARARDRDVDLEVLRDDAAGAFDRAVLGQDDAGPVGLHVADLNVLRAYATRAMPYGRWAIEPGTDELGMVLVAAALVREAGLVPRVRVVYSRPGGETVQDPFEFAPIATTIADVIASCGGVEVAPGAPADVDLFVRVPGTSDEDEARFVEAIASRPWRAAVADLSFLDEGNPGEQRRLMDELIARRVAGAVDAFASWNTTANTVGTALPEAFAVLAGQRFKKYDAKLHLTFTFMRYVDDVLFQKVVRPQLNADLTAAGVADHSYLLAPDARRAAAENDALLRPLALDLLTKIAPAHRVLRLDTSLPWHRTFETRLDVLLTP